MCKWALKPTWLQMKTPRAVEMPRAAPGLVWGQRTPLASCPRSQPHSTADGDGFQGLGRSPLRPALSLVAHICPERIVSLRQPCLMLWRTSRYVQNGKQKASGNRASRSGIWLAPWERAVKRHGWTDCKSSPIAHQLVPFSVWNTKKHCAKKPRLSSPKPHKDKSVVLQLCVNCAALNVSKKRLFHY